MYWVLFNRYKLIIAMLGIGRAITSVPIQTLKKWPGALLSPRDFGAVGKEIADVGTLTECVALDLYLWRETQGEV
jgi:hypothetical protein